MQGGALRALLSRKAGSRTDAVEATNVARPRFEGYAGYGFRELEVAHHVVVGFDYQYASPNLPLSLLAMLLSSECARATVLRLGVSLGTPPDASNSGPREGDGMTTPKQLTPNGVPDAYEPESRVERLEEEALVGGIAFAAALRAAAVLFVVLLVCWPLAILAVIVVAPLLVIALVLGLLAAIVSVPYLLFHHFHGDDGGHLLLLAHRLRRAARALIDLAPHRIVADARKLHAGRSATTASNTTSSH